MKNSPKNIGLLMVTLIAISVGFTYVTVTGIHQDVELDRVSSGSLLNGNVLVRVFDEAGAVKAFRQTDNHIVVSGMEILASQLFNDTRGSTGYTADSWRNWTDNDITDGTGNSPGENTGGTIKYMEIGNGTASLQPDDGELHAALSDAQDGAMSPDCNRQIAQIDNGTDSSGNDDAGLSPNPAFAQINITAIATFDGMDCAAGVIQEAGIWTDSNSTSAATPGVPDAGWMFARNTFGSVSLTSNDSLELTWTFTFTDS